MRKRAQYIATAGMAIAFMIASFGGICTVQAGHGGPPGPGGAQHSGGGPGMGPRGGMYGPPMGLHPPGMGPGSMNHMGGGPGRPPGFSHSREYGPPHRVMTHPVGRPPMGYRPVMYGPPISHYRPSVYEPPIMYGRPHRVMGWYDDGYYCHHNSDWAIAFTVMAIAAATCGDDW